MLAAKSLLVPEVPAVESAEVPAVEFAVESAVESAVVTEVSSWAKSMPC